MCQNEGMTTTQTLKGSQPMTEWGIFSDEGCLERGLYGAATVADALATYNPDDNAEALPLCGCDADCECPQGMCECEEHQW